MAEPTPAKTPQQALAEQYDFASIEAAPSGRAAEAPVPQEPAPHSSAPRERDPATGRFLPQHQHAPYLTRMAKDLGLEDDEIGDMTPEVLGETVAGLNRHRQATAREIAQHAAQVQQVQQAPAPSGVTPGTPAADDGLGLDETQYDSGILAAFKKLQARCQAIEERLGQVQGHIQQQTNESTAAKLDRIFDSWNDTEHFGKGAGLEMQPGAPELRRRLAIVNEARAMAGDKATIQQVLAKLPDARKLLYPAAVKPPAQEPTAPAPDSLEEQWRQGPLARPTNRSPSPEPRGRGRAEKAVAQFQRDSALANGDSGVTEDDFLP